MRQRKIAEVGKLNAETDKIKAEAEKIRAEFRTMTALQQPAVGEAGAAPPHPTADRADGGRVKLLFAAAEPLDLQRFRLGDEIRGITRGLRTSKHGDSFEIEQLWGARWADLRTHLLQDTPDILHFCGYPSEHGLVFEDDSGRADKISTEQVAALLSLFSDRLRLVIINTMKTDDLCETLARTIDYVIGTTGRITDEAAIKFSAAFYEAIGNGKTIRMALEFASAYSRTAEGSYKLFAEREAAEPHLLPMMGC